MQVAEEAGAAASGDDERGQRVTNLLKGGVLFVKVCYQTFKPCSCRQSKKWTPSGSVPVCCTEPFYVCSSFGDIVKCFGVRKRCS